jgi:hypothetical protein
MGFLKQYQIDEIKEKLVSDKSKLGAMEIERMVYAEKL